MPTTKAIVKSADMVEEQQQTAVDVAAEALAKHGLEKDVAAFVKKEFDKKFGPTWHCIVGKNFGRSAMKQCLQVQTSFQCIAVVGGGAEMSSTSSSPSSSSPPQQDPTSSTPQVVIVKHVDMDEEGVKSATQTAAELLEQEASLGDLAEKLKKTFDELYGPRWHCVVGRPFAR
ncbi:unnamed protein product [Schistocephalus solidus]|uniref:Dynein light chain n=1 Tax=Schistocephalus solidus TaxID=70667 RepID=A0A183SGC3_SCHSO|nr:unnamed protein product [Schistocephalus solidus]